MSRRQSCQQVCQAAAAASAARHSLSLLHSEPDLGEQMRPLMLSGGLPAHWAGGFCINESPVLRQIGRHGQALIVLDPCLAQVGDALDANGCLDAADKALYAAKKAGRNRVAAAPAPREADAGRA